MDKRTRNLIIVFAIITAFTVGAMSFTTIYNAPATVAPSFSWSYKDNVGAEIPNIHTATISGVVTFEATVTNSPVPAVENVKLVVDKSDGTYIGEWVFAGEGNVHSLLFDTTTLPNGQYNFVFSYSLVDDGGGGNGPEYTDFSMLAFIFDDGSGSELVTTTFPPLYMFLLAAGGIIIVAAIICRRR